MNLLERIAPVKPLAPTAEDAPHGNLDDALEADARMKSLATSAPRNAIPSPFSVEMPAAPQQRFSLSLKPTAKSIHINSTHPLESTVEDIGGEISISIRW